MNSTAKMGWVETKLALFSLIIIFFISGMSSLFFQIAWRRVLAQEIGIDHAAITVVVAIFILGLSIGSLIGGRLSKKINKRGVVAVSAVYFVVELVIAVYGYSSVSLLHYIGSLTASLAIQNIWVQFFVYFVALVIPTTLMGMTLPLMVQIGSYFLTGAGANLGVLYGINIVGAALGALLADVILIEMIGVSSVAKVAAGLDLCLPLIFGVLNASWLIRRRLPAQPHGGAQAEPVSAVYGMSPIMIGCIAVGFVTLSLEVLLFRLVSHYFRSNTYCFSIMLFSYLINMGVGNFIFGFVGDKFAKNKESRAKILILLSAAMFASISLIFRIKEITAYFFPESPFLHPHHVSYESMSVASTMTGMVAISLVFMLPVLFASGFYPLIVATTTGKDDSRGEVTGRLYFWFAIGNAIGVVITGFVFLPLLGTVVTTYTLMLATVVGIALLIGRRADMIKPHVKWFIPVSIIAALVIPANYYYSFKYKRSDWTFGTVDTGADDVVEGMTGVLEVFFGNRTVMLNGIDYTGGLLTRYDQPFERTLMPAFFIDRPLKRMLIIGVGHGDLALGYDSYPEKPIVDVAELSDEIVSLFRKEKYTPDFGIKHFAGEYGLNMRVVDGRRWVNEACSAGIRYDFIELGITRPSSGTSGNLYTTEFLKKLKDCITDDGVVQIYSFRSALRTAAEVFDNIYYVTGSFEDGSLYSEVFLSKNPITPVWDKARMAAILQSIDDHARPDYARSKEDGATIGLRRFDKKLVEEYPINDDDHIIMSYNWLWRLNHPQLKLPIIRLISGVDFDPKVLQDVPVIVR